MPKVILAVDCGAWRTTAAVTTPDRVSLLSDPATGAVRWPSSLVVERENLLIGGAAEWRRERLPGQYARSLRRALDTGAPVRLGHRQWSGAQALSGYLRVIVDEAERMHGGRMDRLLLTTPPEYRTHDRRREALVAAAGSPDAELVCDAVAALLDPALRMEFPDGSLVLAVDLGVTWTATLLRMDRTRPVPVGQESAGDGQDLDRLLLDDLRATVRDWLAPRLTADGESVGWLRHACADLVRDLKHQVCATGEPAAGQLAPDAPTYLLTRATLDRCAEPALRWLAASCRALIARANASVAGITGVVVTGGGAHLPGAAANLADALNLPVHVAPEPELGVIRGAAARARAALGRRVLAEPPRWRTEPLSWALPDGPTRLVRWLVGEGERYPAGALLAQARTADDRVFDLAASRAGTLLEQRVAAGETLAPATVAGTSRVPVDGPTGDSLHLRHRLKVSGEWLLTPDRRLLVECTRDGAAVRVRSISDGAVVHELAPLPHPQRGRIFFGPLGEVARVSWDDGGRFAVRDVCTGALLAAFHAERPPTTVLVNEADWRLLAQTDGVRAGRYRRHVATIWDLHAGTRIRRFVGDDRQRGEHGYTGRSAADGFAARMQSPDGSLRVVATDGGALTLLDARTDRELFRAANAPGPRVRAAFSADGLHLLANWQSDEVGWVDILQLA